LLQLYTFAGEVVLDPFMGSGSTALAALQAGRHYVGYEISQEYLKLAETRLQRFSQEKKILSLFPLQPNKL
jgi:site-specific DNA-methyltransferase (adenine-specific)